MRNDRPLSNVAFFGSLLILSACQLVTKNNHTNPPIVQTEPNSDILSNMIANEVLPSLTTARASLTILDSVRSAQKSDDSLADFVYDLEKSFRSTALPKTSTSSPGDKDFLEIELPFVVGKYNQKLLAKIAKNRDARDQVFDMFGIVPPPPAPKNQTVPLLSRMYMSASDSNTTSFWFFDMLAFNSFLMDLRDSKTNVLDPEISMQFTTTSDSLELSVWSENYKPGALGVKWRRFHSESKFGSSANIKVSMAVLCNQKDTSIEFEVARNSATNMLNDLVKNAINTQLESSCIVK